MGYTQSAISGFSWQTVLKILQNLITLAKIFILARLLSPNDFGLFSLIAITLGIAEATTQTGINITIIQSKQSIGYFLNTAWVLAILRGILIGILMVALGLFMGNFYSQPQLPLFIALASLVPIIKGFINPSIILLHKNLEFFKDSLYRLSLTVVDGVLAIILAYWLHSVWALIFAMIGAAFFEVVISFLFFSERPVFSYIPNRAKTILTNAKWLSLSSLLSYANDNVDDFILGKTVGTYNLGLYHNGYSLGHKTNYDITKSVGHGTLPIFTKIGADKPRLKNAFVRSMTVSSLLAIVISLPLFIFPEFVVSLLLGSQWLAITEYLGVITFAGLVHALSTSTYPLFLATKNYKIINSHLFVTLLVMLPLILYGSINYGVLGACVAIAVARCVSAPIIALGIHHEFK